MSFNRNWVLAYYTNNIIQILLSTIWPGEFLAAHLMEYSRDIQMKALGIDLLLMLSVPCLKGPK